MGLIERKLYATKLLQKMSMELLIAACAMFFVLILLLSIGRSQFSSARVITKQSCVPVDLENQTLAQHAWFDALGDSRCDNPAFGLCTFDTEVTIELCDRLSSPSSVSCQAFWCQNQTRNQFNRYIETLNPLVINPYFVGNVALLNLANALDRLMNVILLYIRYWKRIDVTGKALGGVFVAGNILFVMWQIFFMYQLYIASWVLSVYGVLHDPAGLWVWFVQMTILLLTIAALSVSIFVVRKRRDVFERLVLPGTYDSADTVSLAVRLEALEKKMAALVAQNEENISF